MRISPIDIDRKDKELITLDIDAGKHVISISLVSRSVHISPSVSGSYNLFFFNEMQVERERLSWQITRGSMPNDELIAGGVIEGADMNCFRDTVMLWRIQRGKHHEKDASDNPDALITSPLPRKRSELP